MKNKINNHFENNHIIKKTKESMTYQLNTNNNSSEATVFSVFPGIDVTFVKIEGSEYLPSIKHHNEQIEINYCLKGRIECIMSDSCFLYIGEQDTFITTLSNHAEKLDIPLNYYEGIVVTIDIFEFKKHKLFQKTPIDLEEITARLFDSCACCLFIQNEKLMNIFQDMPIIPSKSKLMYLRIKITELLLYLLYVEDDNKNVPTMYSREQIDVIKEIQKYLMSHMEQRFTIEFLSQEFGISSTALKEQFKQRYGEPIATYMKHQRMQKARSLIKDTSLPISEIAYSLGYKNQSKFSTAFKEWCGMTPSSFKKR